MKQNHFMNDFEFKNLQEPSFLKILHSVTGIASSFGHLYFDLALKFKVEKI